MPMPRRPDRERGAVAVEFALVAPVLLLLLIGTIALGQTFFVQASLANAARDAVRIVALQRTDGTRTPVELAVATAIESAAGAAALDPSHITVTPTSCADPGSLNTTAQVQIDYPIDFLGVGRLFGIEEIVLTGKGTMRCNG